MRVAGGISRALAMAFALVAVLLTACGGGAAASESATSGSPVYFGALVAETGTYGTFGTQMVAALKAETDLLNKEGGVLGRPIKLVITDDQSTPSVAASAAQNMISNNPHLAFALLDNVSTDTAAMLPTFNAAKVITMTRAGTPALAVVSSFPYNFIIYPPQTSFGPATVAAIKKLHGQKIAVLNGNDTADVTAAQIETAGMQKAGLSVVSNQAFDPTATDLSVQVAQARAAGADTLFVQVASSANLVVDQAVQQLGWKGVHIIETNGATNSSVMSNVPEGVRSQVHVMSGRSYLGENGTPIVPAERAFVKELAKQGQVTDADQAVCAAYAENLAVWAMNTAHSTDSSKVKSVLQTLAHKSPPSNTLISYPNPRWSSTVHDMSHASISDFYALYTPAAPINGTYPGVPISS